MGTKVRVRRKKSHELEAAGKKVDLRKKSGRTKEERRLLQIQALEIRQSGATYAQIATALGLADASQARKYVNSALDRLEIEAAKEVVRLDLSRLDEFQMRCTHALRQNGDLGQVDRIMRIMEMRYRLLGVTDETVKQLQSDYGITNVHNTTNIIQNVTAAPETQEEFVAKMMRAVGVDPESEEAQRYIEAKRRTGDDETLPLPPGSANDAGFVSANAPDLAEEEVVMGEIVEA